MNKLWGKKKDHLLLHSSCQFGEFLQMPVYTYKPLLMVIALSLKTDQLKGRLKRGLKTHGVKLT